MGDRAWTAKAWWTKDRRDNLVFLGAVVLVLLIIGLGIGFAPSLADHLNDGVDPPTTSSADVIDIAVRIALAVVATVAGWLTFRRIRATERTAAANESGQETDRFTAAIDQLGNDQVNIRIGGLYSLQALAQDNSKRFAATIYDVIIAFIREQTRPDSDVERARKVNTDYWADLRQNNRFGWQPDYEDVLAEPPKPDWPQSGTDVETALKILTASRALFDEYHPDLEPGLPDLGPNLTGADLSGQVLVGLGFFGATLTDTIFVGATLTNTIFIGATVTSAHFGWATVTDTDFIDATLTRTNFSKATLTRTNFSDATLTDTNFSDATLTDTSFSDATLTDTNLADAKRIRVAMPDGIVVDHSRSPWEK